MLIKLSLFFATTVFLSQSLWANVIGSDSQNFAPTQDGIDFVTVHSSETLEPGIINFGFFINYAQNTFPAFEGSGGAPSQSLLDVNDSLTSADFNFAVGLFENFQFGLSVPYIIDQTIDNDDNLGRFEGSGTSEIRPSLKYKFYQTENWGFATVLSANFNRIDNNPYLGEGAGPTWNLELVADRSFGKWNWGTNIGHRWREPGEAFANTGIDPLPNQFIYSTALSYLFSSIDTKLIGEIYGSSPVSSTENLSNRQNSSLEALMGIKHDLTSNTSLHAGMGSELAQGTSTPDWRVYAGINITLGPVFNKEPKLKEERIQQTIKITMSQLKFKFNSDELTVSSQRIVDQLVDRIRELNYNQAFRIEGYTDSIGAAAYNQQLSLKRAETVKRILIKKVPLKKSQISAVGLGETNPIADNGNYQGRQANRRVEIKFEAKK